MRLVEWSFESGMLWSMVGAGAGLTLVSVQQTSERFWHWKRARQIIQGDVVPAASALRPGQTLEFVMQDAQQGNQATGQPASQSGKYAAQIIAVSPRVMLFSLESADITPGSHSEISLQAALPTLRVGETPQLQAAGNGALYRLEARIRAMRPDPTSPGRQLITAAVPSWAARVQRRDHVRAAIQAGVTLWPQRHLDSEIETNSNRTVVTTMPKIADASKLRGALLDLSGGGLRLELGAGYSPHTVARLHEQLLVGDTLEVKLDLPLLRETPLHLTIRSCQRIAARGGLALCLRGEFFTLPALQKETLAAYVLQAHRE